MIPYLSTFSTFQIQRLLENGGLTSAELRQVEQELHYRDEANRLGYTGFRGPAAKQAVEAHLGGAPTCRHGILEAIPCRACDRLAYAKHARRFKAEEAGRRIVRD